MERWVAIIVVLAVLLAGALAVYFLRRAPKPDPRDSVVEQEAELLARQKGKAGVRLGEPQRMTAGEFLKAAEAERRDEEAKYAAYPCRFSITIFAPVGPLERGERFEEPMRKALGDFGVVLGGGSSMATVDGRTVITDVGFSVRVKELEKGLAIIRKTLIAQGAPRDTKIEQRAPEERAFSLEEK